MGSKYALRWAAGRSLRCGTVTAWPPAEFTKNLLLFQIDMQSEVDRQIRPAGNRS